MTSDPRDNNGWLLLGSRIVHRTPRLTVRVDDLALPGGRTTDYTVIACGDCVGVLPFVDDDHVVMVRQWRYIVGRTTWEMPTGGVHAGESLEQAAQRELAEEAGFHARTLRHVSTYHTSKSSIDETAHIYVGTDLVPAEARQDEDEDAVRCIVPLRDVVQKVLRGEITDSMTVIAVLTIARERGL